MNKMFSEEIASAVPIYTVVNMAVVPLNPFREFVSYCVKQAYPKFEHMFDMSLDEFFLTSDEEKKNFIKKLQELMPNAKFTLLEQTSHPRIFLECNIYSKDNDELCNFKFYTHLDYISTKKVSDDSHTACEIDFTGNSSLDFLNINKADQIFDFNRDYSNKNTIDMIVAHLYGFANFTDFIRHFKTKSLIVKNIEMFSKKMIAPYVEDLTVLYGADEFIIGSLCGGDINKEAYPYENYLNSIKQYAEYIKSIYGNKYYHEETIEDPNNNSNIGTSTF